MSHSVRRGAVLVSLIQSGGELYLSHSFSQGSCTCLTNSVRRGAALVSLIQSGGELYLSHSFSQEGSCLTHSQEGSCTCLTHSVRRGAVLVSLINSVRRGAAFIQSGGELYLSHSFTHLSHSFSQEGSCTCLTHSVRRGAALVSLIQSGGELHLSHIVCTHIQSGAGQLYLSHSFSQEGSCCTCLTHSVRRGAVLVSLIQSGGELHLSHSFCALVSLIQSAGLTHSVGALVSPLSGGELHSFSQEGSCTCLTHSVRRGAALVSLIQSGGELHLSHSFS